LNNTIKTKALIQYPELYKTSRVKYELIINPMDEQTKEFMIDWYYVYQMIKKDTDFVPTFYF